MMATTANIVRGYHDLESEICEGCDGRGRCPDRPCVEEAEYSDQSIAAGKKFADELVAMIRGMK